MNEPDIDMSVFLSKTTFSQYIEDKVKNEGSTYFSAIIDFSEDCDKSPEELIPFMSQVLIDKIKKSANDLGLIDTGEVSLEDLLKDDDTSTSI